MLTFEYSPKETALFVIFAFASLADNFAAIRGISAQVFGGFAIPAPKNISLFQYITSGSIKNGIPKNPSGLSYIDASCTKVSSNVRVGMVLTGIG